MSKKEKYENAAHVLQEFYDDLDMTRSNLAAQARVESDSDIRGLYADICSEVDKVKRRVINYIDICEEWSER